MSLPLLTLATYDSLIRLVISVLFPTPSVITETTMRSGEKRCSAMKNKRHLAS